MHLAQCRQCLKMATISDGGNVHAAVDDAGCGCCSQAHNHGAAAAATGVECRPLIITLMPGSLPADLTDTGAIYG